MSDWASTLQQGATVRLADGSELEGVVHLFDAVPNREGPETPLDMLNREDAFFVLSGEDGQIHFISKAQVASVTTEAAPFISYLILTGARETKLEVELIGGTRRAGRVMLEQHPTRPRALDYLNGHWPFFLLLDEPMAHFLNRAHVTVARPRD